MPELRIKDVRLPELRLPEMSRQDINKALGEVRRDIADASRDIAEASRDVDLSKVEMPKIDLSKVDLSKVELPEGRHLARRRVQGVRQCGPGGWRPQVAVAHPLRHRGHRDARCRGLGDAQLAADAAPACRGAIGPASGSTSSGSGTSPRRTSRGLSMRAVAVPVEPSAYSDAIGSTNSPYAQPPSDLPDGLGSATRDEVARA